MKSTGTTTPPDQMKVRKRKRVRQAAPPRSDGIGLRRRQVDGRRHRRQARAERGQEVRVRRIVATERRDDMGQTPGHRHGRGDGSLDQAIEAGIQNRY